jgi:hypothetical protein
MTLNSLTDPIHGLIGLVGKITTRNPDVPVPDKNARRVQHKIWAMVRPRMGYFEVATSGGICFTVRGRQFSISAKKVRGDVVKRVTGSHQRLVTVRPPEAQLDLTWPCPK